MLDDIPITIQKSKKIKTLSLNITPSLEVILKMPDSCPQARANAFLKEQEAWLKKNLFKHARKTLALTLAPKHL
ncbi:DUF45 domain-containing protein [Helicobacter pylori]|nr:DUF45 domain-containing protein [Helicobacter pylori]